MEKFVINGRETWANEKVANGKGLINNPNGAWAAGLYEVTFTPANIQAGAKMEEYVSFTNTFHPYGAFNSSNTSTSSILLEASGKGGNYLARALYLRNDSTYAGGWAMYLTTGVQYGSFGEGMPIVDGYKYAPTIRYTAEFGGNIEITLDGGWYDAFASGYQYLFVRHNGVVVKKIVNDEGKDVLEKITIDNVNKGDIIDFISAADPMLSKEYSQYDSVAAGKWQDLTDKHPLYLRRGFRIDNINVAPITALDFNTNVNLTINDAYGVNMSAAPLAKDGKVAALINGEWVEGTLTDGAYDFILKDGINVSDLTATGNGDGVTVSYQLKEIVNGHTVISPEYSTTTNEMLAYYESGVVGAEAAALAKDIRHLAVAANAAINDSEGSSLSYAEKVYIKDKSDAALTALKEAGVNVSYTGTEGDFKIVGANVNMDNRLSMVLAMSAIGDKTLEDLRNGGYYVEAVCGGEVRSTMTIRYIELENGGYMGAIVSVPISMWDQQFAYTIKDADGNAVSDTLNYSVKDWCIRKYTGEDGDQNRTYVVRALYNLGVSAAAYKASLA